MSNVRDNSDDASGETGAVGGLQQLRVVKFDTGRNQEISPPPPQFTSPFEGGDDEAISPVIADTDGSGAAAGGASAMTRRASSVNDEVKAISAQLKKSGLCQKRMACFDYQLCGSVPASRVSLHI